MMGLHQQAVKEYGYIMNWDEIVVEGYCIMNAECKAAQLTKANTNLDADDVAAYAMMAEKMFHLPIFYLEYSGKYGEVSSCEAAKEDLRKHRSILWWWYYIGRAGKRNGTVCGCYCCW